MKYAMTIQNVIDLYNHRKVPKYRDRFDKAFTILYVILKVWFQDSFYRFIITCFRAHPQLLFEDLRILAIDFDPQASLTMFLSHENSVGLVENTAAQAMLQNVSREELLSDL